MALSKDPGQATAQEFENSLKDNAHQLVEYLEQGQFGEAILVVHAINQARDRGLYHEVGQLTRALHNAIVNFQLDTSHALGEQHPDTEGSKIADASDRLDYVVKLTESAANKTMDLVDDTLPVATELGQQAAALKADWQRLQRREMAAGEFRDLYRRMGEFLEQTEQSSGQISANLNDIMLAQDFQDLTGQVIKRVTTLVHDVEESLVSLVRMAGHVDRIAGIKHDEKQQEEKKTSTGGEGPQIHADKREDVVSGQDEVDDLLSSLGF